MEEINMNVINSSPNGQIFTCPCHNLLQLEFGNLFMHLTYDELAFFLEYMNSIDHGHFLTKNKSARNRGKLLLSIGSRKVYLVLNLQEFLELKDLLSLKKYNPSILVPSGIFENFTLN